MKRHGYLRLALNRIFIYLTLFVPAFLISQPAICGQSPSFKSKLKFSYPLSAERNGIEGVVVGRVLVAENGRPVKAEILKRESPECWVFDDSVISALMKASYRPGMKDGKPVRRWLTLPVRFRLKDSTLEQWKAKVYPYDKSKKPYVKLPKKQRSSSALTLKLKDNKGRVYVKVLKVKEVKDYWNKHEAVLKRKNHPAYLKLLKKPYYPSKAKLSGTEGIVYVRVSVNKHGVPRKAVVVKHDPFNCKIFDRSAVKAAMESEYYPARRNGRPVDGSVTIYVPYFYVQKFPRPVYCGIKNVSNASL